MKKVLILVNGLYIGGFSKSLINLLHCNNETVSGIRLYVFNLCHNKSPLEKDIPENIQIIHNKPTPLQTSFSKKCRQFFYKIKYVSTEYFYRYVKKQAVPTSAVREYSQAKSSVLADSIRIDTENFKDFDVIVSWEESYCNYVLANCFPGFKTVGYIHPNYLEAEFSKAVDKRYLKKLDRIVTISNSCMETLKRVYPEYSKKILMIPNRLNQNYYNTLANEYSANMVESGFRAVSVVRIVNSHKAVFRIVDVVKRIVSEGRNITWYIIGDGPDLDELKHRIEKEGLCKHIICTGAMNNPYPYMKEADLYIQQSYYEGKPVSVDEAMLLGTPALVTNYSSAHEQVDDGINGWVVDNNEQKIYEKLAELLDHSQEIEKARDNLKKKDFSEFEDCRAFVSMIYELTEKNNGESL